TNAGPDFVNTNGTHFTSLGGNLVGNNQGDATFTKTGDQTGTDTAPLDPLLGPLRGNGDPTDGAAGTSLVLETEALQAGSKAIDKGVAVSLVPSGVQPDLFILSGFVGSQEYIQDALNHPLGLSAVPATRSRRASRNRRRGRPGAEGRASPAGR